MKSTQLKNSPLVSVLTPTWNRSNYLNNVWEGLNKQLYNNFEWVIGNDGSIDNTESLVKELASKSHFPVKLVSSNVRVGKAVIDNLLMSHARGDLLFWNDSDDQLVPLSLKTLVEAWESINDNRKYEYCGIVAQCATANGEIQGQNYNNLTKKIDLTFEDFSKKTSGDAGILVPASLVKNSKFLEVDFVITESSFWSPLFKNKRIIYIPIVVKITDRLAPNSISFGKGLKYTRGMAYAISICEVETIFSTKKLLQKLKLIVNYWRYCYHGDIKLVAAKKLWEITCKYKSTLLLYPISFLLIVRDIFFANVEKTHINFEKSKNDCIITITELNK